MSDRPLRVLSIAHTAVSRETGRLRYHPFASMPGFEVHLLAPSRWQQFGRTTNADPAGDPGVTMHIEPIILPSLPGVKWYGHFHAKLGKIIRRVQPDVIHLWEEPWSHRSPSGHPSASQCRLGDRSRSEHLEAAAAALRDHSPLMSCAGRTLSSRAAPMQPPSCAPAALLGRCGPSATAWIAACSSPAHEPAPSRPEGAALRLGYVGRLIEEKGLGDALRAMTLAAAPIELAVMGEGPYEGQLRGAAKSLVSKPASASAAGAARARWLALSGPAISHCF